MRIRAHPVLLPALLLAAACSTTRLETSEAGPGAANAQIETFMVLVATPDLPVRKRAEDALVHEIGELTVIPSYEVIPNERDISDQKLIRFHLLNNDCDAIVILRPAYTEREIHAFTEREPAAPYWDFDSYYHPNRGLSSFESNSGEIYIDEVHGIEIAIYETDGFQLVWSGRIRASAPSSVDALMGEVTRTVRRRLRHDGIGN